MDLFVSNTWLDCAKPALHHCSDWIEPFLLLLLWLPCIINSFHHWPEQFPADRRASYRIEHEQLLSWIFPMSRSRNKQFYLFIFLFSLLLSSRLLSRGIVFWLSEAAELLREWENLTGATIPLKSTSSPADTKKSNVYKLARSRRTTGGRFFGFHPSCAAWLRHCSTVVQKESRAVSLLNCSHLTT